MTLGACASAPERPPSTAQTNSQTLSLNGARALQRGDPNAALAAYGNALAAAESVEDFELAGAMLVNLALVHSRLGQTQAAHARLDTILNAPQRFSDALRSQAAARKAILHLDAGSHGIAMHWADRARDRCADPCPLAPTLANLRAAVALARGDHELALGQATRAGELAVALRNDAEHANALRLSGRAHTQLGQTQPAAQVLARALEIDRELGLPERIALDLTYAGENEERRGAAGAAREYFERALNVAAAARLESMATALRARLGKPQ